MLDAFYMSERQNHNLNKQKKIIIVMFKCTRQKNEIQNFKNRNRCCPYLCVWLCQYVCVCWLVCELLCMLCMIC